MRIKVTPEVFAQPQRPSSPKAMRSMDIRLQHHPTHFGKVVFSDHKVFSESKTEAAQ
jgi:hypothetical protein